jgi:hypothetical protein
MFRRNYKKLNKIYIGIVIIIILSICTTEISLCDSERKSRYILIYKDLYYYGEKHSDVISLYIQIKSDCKEAILLQASQFKNIKIEKGDVIIIVKSSFRSEKEYKNIIEYYRDKEIKIYDDEKIMDENIIKNRGYFIAVDRVYPFSNLNGLMEVAEDLNNKGITFICTIMPVYENYELEAYDKFMEVLKYVSKKGGKFFIHYPIFNEEGTYNIDPRDGFKRSIEEYRKKGIEIVGISIPKDKVFTNTRVFQGLNLPFLFVTEEETKVDSNIDLLKISQELNKHIFIKGNEIDEFNFFSYINKEDYNYNQGIYVDINKDIKKLYNFISILYSKKIPIRDFKAKEYYLELKNFNFGKGISDIEEIEKSQLERFKTKEMEKIRGENLEKEEYNEQGYDISHIVRIGIKTAFFIIFLLIIQILIGRRYDIKKFFKD